MTSKVAIVIPIYKRNFDDFEDISIDRCLKVLSNYPIIFAAPQSLDVNGYGNLLENYEIKRFHDQYFRNIAGYNQLMMSKLFYEQFTTYEKILIYQPDAFVFSDDLIKFADLDYDYFGAPWPEGSMIQEYTFRGSHFLNKILPFFNSPKKYYVGNGGFSLRNVYSSLRLLSYAYWFKNVWSANEDLFWSVCGRRYHHIFRIAPFNISLQFAFELQFEKCLELNNGKLPFGCHAWAKYNIQFMIPFLNKCGYEITDCE